MLSARAASDSAQIPIRRLLILGAARAAIASKGPTDSDRGVKAVGAIRMKVRRAQRVAVPADKIHLVLSHSKLEILWQLESRADGALESHGFHRCSVLNLRDVVSKAHFRIQEQEKVARESAADRLQLNVSTEQVARIGRARRSGAASARRLWKHAAAEVWLIVRRGYGKIRITTNPVVREKCPRGSHRGRRVIRHHDCCLRLSGRNEWSYEQN